MEGINRLSGYMLFLAVCVLFFYCNTNGVHSKPSGQKFFGKDSTKMALKNTPYFITNSSDDWSARFIGSHDNFDSLSIRFHKIEKDTSKDVIFSVDRKLNAVSVLMYQKKYNGTKGKYFVRYGRTDTLYCYYTSDGSQKKTFVVGEYFHRGENLGFDLAERPYYLLHKDSLDRIHGNDLPKLPVVRK